MTETAVSTPSPAPGTSNAYDVLVERGFVKDVSDADGLRRALERPSTFYAGFDPTSSSLTVGHLVPVMAMAHLARHGHRPIVVVGGGTALVGDPSGKTATRAVLTPEQIKANLGPMREQLAHYFSFDEGRAIMVDNADWLVPLRYIEFLRDVGRHFNVNQMLHHETYRDRVGSEAGLNFVEFNYMLVQAYDFLHLYGTYQCILQVGGSDQWANILAGVDLIRKVEGGTAYALTSPLIMTASGAKMGKTEAGAVWLDPARTSPYDYYQFWINTEDPDVERFLALFTFLPMDEVRALGRLRDAALREAKERLAYEATALTHGEAAAREAQAAARALFRRGAARGSAGASAQSSAVTHREAAVIGNVGASGQSSAIAIPTTVISTAELEAGIEATELLVRTRLCSSKADARRLIHQGGAYANNRPIERPDTLLTLRDLEDDQLLLRKGKKQYHRVVAE